MVQYGSPQRLGLGLAVLAVILDQVTKFWFFRFLVEGGRGAVEVLPFFNLVTVWNYGVSFGMFNSGSSAAAWIFAVLALAIAAALAVWLLRTDRPLIAAALGLVVGGAVGNVVDRVRFGAVFDFLDFHAFGWHWPAFNVADSAITIGVAALFIDSLFDGRRGSKNGGS